jgi:hypothetical protein
MTGYDARMLALPTVKARRKQSALSAITNAIRYWWVRPVNSTPRTFRPIGNVGGVELTAVTSLVPSLGVVGLVTSPKICGTRCRESLLDRLIDNSHLRVMNGAGYRPHERPGRVVPQDTATPR